MASKYPQTWTMSPGALFRWQATWYEGRDPDTGDYDDPVDITGYYFRCQGKSSSTSETILFDVDSNELGGITVGDELGTVVVEIAAQVTAELAGLRGVWAIWLYEPGEPDPIDWLEGDWRCGQLAVDMEA